MPQLTEVKPAISKGIFKPRCFHKDKDLPNFAFISALPFYWKIRLYHLKGNSEVATEKSETGCVCVIR